jgi:cytochrome c peroxidase
MRYASNLALAVSSALFAVAALVACGRNDGGDGSAGAAFTDPPATDAMRLGALRKAALANGFVRSGELAVPVVSARHDVGRLIFASPIMSLNGRISCQDCHLDQFGSADGLPNAIGVGGATCSHFGVAEAAASTRSSGTAACSWSMVTS